MVINIDENNQLNPDYFSYKEEYNGLRMDYYSQENLTLTDSQEFSYYMDTEIIEEEQYLMDVVEAAARNCTLRMEHIEALNITDDWTLLAR